MKKFAHRVAYIAGGIIIGIVFSTTTGAFADTVKSMVGKKVTGEYTIVVDGKKLSDKGAVIDSKANVPARALSEALGADVKVSGKTITITSDEQDAASVIVPDSNENEFIGRSKADLESTKQIITDKILNRTQQAKEDVTKWLQESEEKGDEAGASQWRQELAQYEKDIEKAKSDLAKIDAALAANK
ncbi:MULTISPECIES: stalk domain-containing protein [unclassified Paenibacillus]|uniref:stalk domain-containing protein n=1 Tax=unclassified Paenibacillus TaxID=185978 RepID=UPI0009A5F102|nr:MULTISPECIES: stalk domain-containing protein [unclassified Paenibacillus]SLJ98073.1 hypothetical protein SAMN06272722_102691 [Paenibacillus sp. RU5A]SOC66824.1 hypothetical protein SAMN05880581_102306 [Paenibacillus sp. RU26A]SOC70027.1 hypothetical protein SAMN05880586_102691 [Paenibacillus sp. RU5M]